MDKVFREKVASCEGKGKVVKEAFGADGYIKDNDARMGFMTLTAESADEKYESPQTEVYYVEKANGVKINYNGVSEDLEKTDVLVTAKGDTYCFEFENADSFVDFMYIIPTKKN